MRFIPNYKLNVIAEEDYSSEIANIESVLDKIKITGSFKAFDGINIAYEYFLAENSVASVVIVHGLSEFSRKFYESIYYFLNQGLNVFIFDQRCHGLSGRLTDELDLLHVGDFYDYVDDLSRFIDDIVLKTEDKPLYLYSHSMGGAISALYLAKSNPKIKKAVLSAPMFEPIVESVPVPIARCGVRVGKRFYGSKTKFLLTHEFDPDIKYKEEYGSSKARFEHNLQMRRENPNYRSTPMTFGWVYNSLTVCKKIFNKNVIGNIKTPILIISAENDVTVNNKPQYKFAQKCSNCRIENIENATHALLVSDKQTVTKVIKLTLDFYFD
ncbi:MAG: alpha/beta hydrolase [Clostridia bacterium]|nr:alpha/beta hydrolase [Clostridia bacterium]